ncbi:MAG: 50S ribosomal protein L5 [Nanoarchaeota archaeon]|nr:50S ribosomal protein L5 [Nanoarchaeota archaeon]
MNPMKTIKIDKITLNIGAGKDQNRLEKAKILIKNITGIEPVKTVTNKRIPSWGLRPGLPIGYKLTLRKKNAYDLLKRLLEAKDNSLKESQFDDYGNIAFGIHEYIDIPKVKYDPKIGIMGLEICITLTRPGFRIKRRSLKKAKISKNHIIKKEEAIEYMKKEFNVNMGEE